jgi:5-formyltetrahydrofolate cyclo-ligase
MNDDIIIKKKQARSEIRAAMRSLNEDYIADSNKGIFENLSSLPEFQDAKVVFAFYSIGAEPDTHRFIELALKMGKTVALPRCYGKGIMDAAIIKVLMNCRKEF